MNLMTFYTLLRLHKCIKSRKLKLLGLLVASNLGWHHLSVRIDPSLSCNLACRMCNFSSAEYRKKNRGAFNSEEFQDIARVLFPRAFQLVVGCAAEPTTHSGYRELFRLARKYKVPDVSMVTNGQLLTREDIDLMVRYGVNEIILSCHGVKKATYEKFMTGASYEKFHEVLALMKEVRDAGNKHPGLRINYTANRDNLDELKAFFEVFGRYPVDVLQVRPIMDLGGRYRQQFTGDDLPKYNEVLSHLEEACRRHNVAFLANRDDAAYREETRDADLAELVYTYISPKTGGQLGITWSSSHFRQFRRADRWHSRLMKAFFMRSSGEGWMTRSLKY